MYQKLKYFFYSIFCFKRIEKPNLPRIPRRDYFSRPKVPKRDYFKLHKTSMFTYHNRMFNKNHNNL